MCDVDGEGSRTTPVSDADYDLLIHRFAGGDDSALRELLEREEHGLRRHLEERTPPHVLRRLGVSDIFQRTSIELLTVRKKFKNRGKKAFRRLLRVIADRVLAKALEFEHAKRRDVLRQVTPGRPSSGLADPADRVAADRPSPSELAVQLEKIAELKKCFAGLGPGEQKIIHLIEYEQLSYEDAAVRLELSYDAVRKRYGRAMDKLKSLARRAGLAEP